MGFLQLVWWIAVVAGLLAGTSAFAADKDIQDCKTSDRYHNPVADYETCDRALQQMDLPKGLRAELLLARAEAAYFAGRFDLSSVDLDEALTLNPNLNEAYLRRAWTRIRTNQYPGALQDITTLLAQEPDNVDALFAIGNIYQHTSEWEGKTIPAYKRVLEINPNHYLTRLNLASIYKDYKHDYGAALTEYDRILSARDEDLAKVRLWRDPSFPTFDFRGIVLFDRAEMKFDMQDYPKALADFEKLVSDYPHIPDVFLGRGRVYGQLRRFNEELADARAAVKLNSRWPAHRVLEIRALYHVKRYDEALLAATRFIDGTSYSLALAEALFWRGYINKALRHPEESLNDFEQSFVLDPLWQGVALTQVIQSGYYDGEVSDYYGEKARNGLQACILDPECGT